MRPRSDVLYGLSGLLWPVHLKPLPDELLSSWLVRLAHAHGYKVQTMTRLLFGQSSTIWNRDIDRLAPTEIGEVLMRVTGATIEQFEGATLRAYEGTLVEHHTTGGMGRWVVPLGIFHRARKRPGLMFCPQCLDADAVPCFRRRWRLALSTVCTKHACHLMDSCPRCQSPLAPHRADMQSRQHYPRAGLNVHCWKCGFDLRDSQQAGRPDESLVRLQAQLELALQQGYTDWAGNPSMHSLVFFDGLRALIAGITSRQTQERLAGSVWLRGIDLNGWPHTGLETASLPMRRELFRWLSALLGNWPVNFIALIHENKLRYADLKGDSEQRAFWYEDVIRREAGGGYALISQEEANAIADAVEAKYGRFNGSTARKLSGRDITVHVADRQPRRVSDEAYEDLLTSIDHQIAGTLDKMERACLIRDKVMFAAGRVLGLSEGALAGLTIEQVQTQVPGKVEVNFSDVARTPEQARAWVEWYWGKMRLQLRPKPDVDYVFTSPHTGRGFGHSAVGARFQRVVDEAMMPRSIHSYECWVK